MKYKLPKPQNIQDMLNMMFDDITVAPGVFPSLDQLGAAFVDPEGHIVAVSVMDLTFGVYSAAALSMIPKAGADDAIQDKKLFSPLPENLYEVMNICTNLLMDEHTPHLKIHKVFSQPKSIPADLRPAIEKMTDRAAFKVTLPGYGVGVLAFAVT